MFPIGASLTVEQLADRPYDVLAELRRHEPVSWVPAIGAWLVTRRDLAVEAMRDAERFTVDDPRFTTAAVLGPSMLSVDGAEHSRHRRAFASHFTLSAVQERSGNQLIDLATVIVDGVEGAGRAELRSEVAGPMAVATITDFLGLDLSGDRLLAWYRKISDAIVGLTTGRPLSTEAAAAVAGIHGAVEAGVTDGSSAVLSAVASAEALRPEEIPAAASVVLFGAIETSEGMTANLLWHLLSHPDLAERARGDRALLVAAMEESLRLEPAAAVVDRYTTADVELGAVAIPAGELVTVSLLGANRDPDVFADPGRFDPTRSNRRDHLAFVHGPHACIGAHLARLETLTVVEMLLQRLPGLAMDPAASIAPTGLIFRKPDRLLATW